MLLVYRVRKSLKLVNDLVETVCTNNCKLLLWITLCKYKHKVSHFTISFLLLKHDALLLGIVFSNWKKQSVVEKDGFLEDINLLVKMLK